ncbi:hypothetical protein [Rhodococcus sp. H29-C3]|uniref:hypothetical protein n=1 Tax=Rhodococcus sp. H29-C3 TaxID=3046307 RepID=UPI0024BA2D7B|nr:hypothetical protein [Rhodococcus sp. H29-C3]MDJ0362322.1 hypothetical protein [Rhodococcus sp. H29-C3]
MCGELRRNAGRGLCNRCRQRDPDWPRRYSESVTQRMPSPPHWWSGFTEYVITRYHPGGAVDILREISRFVIAEPTLSPHFLRRDCGLPIRTTTERVSIAYFTACGLTLPKNDDRRLTRTLTGYLEGIPDSLYSAVAQYNQDQLAEQHRRISISLSPSSPVTMATRIRVLRDLSQHLMLDRTVSGWAEVTESDLEAFIAAAPKARHQRTYILKRHFAWAKSAKYVLINPAKNLKSGTQSSFTGTLLGVDDQRKLYRRWTDEATPSLERAIGLLSLLHAASNAAIRTLTTASLDHHRSRISLAGRPASIPLDPETWAALLACIRERDDSGIVNRHVIVSRVTQTREAPVSSGFISQQLKPANVTPMLCRQTRLTALVSKLDPKLAATVLGMHDTALLHYRSDTVDHDRLKPEEI